MSIASSRWMLIIPALLLAFILYQSAATLVFLAHSEKAGATVNAIQSYEGKCGYSKNRRSCTRARASLSYLTSRGEKIERTLEAGEVTCGAPTGHYAEGQSIGILYRNDDPETFRVDSVMGIWGTSAVLVPVLLISIVGWQIAAYRAKAGTQEPD